MAKGLDTMVNENTREEVTASDGLQLGHTSVDQTEIQSAEEDVKNLQQKVAQVSSVFLFVFFCSINSIASHCFSSMQFSFYLLIVLSSSSFSLLFLHLLFPPTEQH